MLEFWWCRYRFEDLYRSRRLSHHSALVVAVTTTQPADSTAIAPERSDSRLSHNTRTVGFDLQQPDR
jgi:hypothetical protein